MFVVLFVIHKDGWCRNSSHVLSLILKLVSALMTRKLSIHLIFKMTKGRQNHR